jgi:hypothetical protein
LSALLITTALVQLIGNYGVDVDDLQPPDYKTLGGGFVSTTPMDHADILWPRSQAFGGAGLGAGGGVLNPDPAAQAWEWNVYTTGSRHRKVYTGQTLNASGAALGGCTVMLFNTATGQIVDTQVSDAGGNYKVTDPNAVACFVVAYLPGSPDVAGTTINTLTGA